MCTSHRCREVRGHCIPGQNNSVPQSSSCSHPRRSWNRTTISCARYVDRSQVGIYSASMKEKTINFYTFATIQSIYQKPEEFKHFEIVIIDECHLVNPKNLGSGMFTSFLKAIGAIPKWWDSLPPHTGWELPISRIPSCLIPMI
jgi:hypothetical protein